MDTQQNTTTPTNDDSANNDNNVQITITKKKLPSPVYYIESLNDDTVLIGLEVTLEIRQLGAKKATFISWYDTSHERIMEAAKIVRSRNNFAFKRTESEGGGNYYLFPMTLKIYNEKVRHHLPVNKNFANEQELVAAFLSTLKNAY